MPNEPVLVVTNPLHFAYLPARAACTSIGSTKGLIADYSRQLGFNGKLRVYDVANSNEALIGAHQKTEGVSEASYVTWKAVNTDADVLGNKYQLAHELERKSRIRSMLPVSLFPEFVCITTEDLSALRFEEVLAAVRADDNGLVLQIDYSTGGKGTFFARTSEELQALIPRLAESEQTIVVSRKIAGTSYGLQCLATDEEVYSPGWWHEDLVGIAGVCDISQLDATRYCGALLEDIPELYLPQAKHIVQVVGAALRDLGYGGIFGIDIVVEGSTGNIYVIEVNPRITAVSHVYATAMRACGYEYDYLTAHVEALLGSGNRSDIQKLARIENLKDNYFYLKLQHTGSGIVQLDSTCELGVYDLELRYRRFGFGIDALQDKSELVVIPEMSQAAERSSGGRVFSVIGFGNPVPGGVLSGEWAKRLELMREQFLRPRAL